MKLRFFLCTVVGTALAGSMLMASGARATGIGKEIWIGGGVSWPKYHDNTAMRACAEGSVRYS